MLSLLVCSLLFIKTEGNHYRCGFFYDDNKEQHMFIDAPKPFKNVIYAVLETVTKNGDGVDIVYEKNIIQFTRTMKDKEKYEQFVRSKSSLPKSSKEYEKLISKEFYTIFVDMKAVEKDPSITYLFELALDNNDKLTTRAFHYSEEQQRWEMGRSESDEKN